MVNENYVEGPKAEYPRSRRLRCTACSIRSILTPSFWSPRFSGARRRHEYEFGAIGVQVELRSTHVVVVAAVTGHPAKRQAFAVGDEIVKIDGQTDRKTVDGRISWAKLRGNRNLASN